MRFYQLLSRTALACALAFSLTACDSNDDEDDEGGSSTATGTISGEISGSFSGNAYFFSENGDFGILFYDGEPESLEEEDEYVQFFRSNGSRPGTGDYDILDFLTVAFFDGNTGSDFVAVYKGIGAFDGATTRLVLSEGGEVTISESNDNRLRGTYSFSGFTGIGNDGGSGSAQMSGSFSATRIEAEDLPGGFFDEFVPAAVNR